jgi:hypothetical protein
VADLSSLKDELYDFYQLHRVSERFEADFRYLSEANHEIENLWMKQYHQIPQIKYIMLSEAPLFGENKSYIYNEKAGQTQFFFYSDIGEIINRPINSKQDMFNAFSQLGLMIVDIFPFAFNQTTAIQYSDFSSGKDRKYQMLFGIIYPKYLKLKLDLILKKAKDPVICFYRYARVKDNIHNSLAAKTSSYHGRLILEDAAVSQQGGGINKQRLKEILIGNRRSNQ